MAHEIALRWPNGSPPVALANPQFAVFAGLAIWNGTAFVAQSDATAWVAGCFFPLTPICLHDGTTFSGDYQADMPGGIDLAQSYTIRMYGSSGTPAPGSELPPLQVWPGVVNLGPTAPAGWLDATAFAAGVLPALDGPGPLAADGYPGSLAAARDQCAALLVQITLSPKPSYTAYGRKYSWSEYQALLTAQINDLNRLIAQANPYEIVSRG
jgi:hypothetical protein